MKIMFELKVLVILLFIFLFIPVSYAGRAVRENRVKVLQEADLIFIGEIKSQEKKVETCTTHNIYVIKPEKILKGKTTKKQFIFKTYRHHAKEECPSIHYSYPPQADKMKKGGYVVVTGEIKKNSKEIKITGTFNDRDLDYIGAITGIQVP